MAHKFGCQCRRCKEARSEGRRKAAARRKKLGITSARKVRVSSADDAPPAEDRSSYEHTRHELMSEARRDARYSPRPYEPSPRDRWWLHAPPLLREIRDILLRPPPGGVDELADALYREVSRYLGR